MLAQVARRAEQHRGVTVVPAGVHLAGNNRAIFAPRRLLDEQSVHVGAQADGAVAPAPPVNRGDDPAAADPLDDFIDAPLAQFSRHQPRGARDVEAGFRVAMDIAADFDEFRFVGLQVFQDRHAHEGSRFMLRLWLGFPLRLRRGRRTPWRRRGRRPAPYPGRPPPPLPPSAAAPSLTSSTALYFVVRSAVTATTRLALPSSLVAAIATTPEPTIGFASSASDLRSFISTPETARRKKFDPGDVAHRRGRGRAAAHRELAPGVGELALELALVFQQGLQAARRLADRRAHEMREVGERARIGAQRLARFVTGARLDAPDPRRNRALGGDGDEADVAGVRDMGSAAELHRIRL